MGFYLSQAHSLQLEAFSIAIKRLDSDLPKPKLQFVGSCRNKSDEERLQMLKTKAIELNVNEQVEFHKNVTYRLVRVALSLCSFNDSKHFLCKTKCNKN